MTRKPWRRMTPVAVVAAVAAALFGAAGGGAAPTVAPSNDSLPSISGVPEEGETLVGDAGKWSGTDPIKFAAQWRRCGANGGNCVNVAGATSPVHRLRADDVGHTMRLRVIASNKDGSAAATSRPTGVVKAAIPNAPRSVSAPTISGTPAVDQTLTGETGQWEGTDPITFAFAWQRCDNQGNSCANISGATAKTYKVSSADSGNTLRLRVTASNTAGRTTAFSRVTSVVGGGGPSGAIKLPSGETSIPDSSVSLPDRFIISKFEFNPNPLRSRDQTIIARFRVTDTRGFVIRSALVFVTPLPYGWTTQPAETTTDTNGWAEVQMRANRALPRKAAIVMFVRARKHGDNVLAGVSSRRLVQMLVSIP